MRIEHQPGIEPLLAALDQETDALGARALLVGGYVRDRVLGRPCKDVDVVVEEGRGLDLARAVAARISDRPPVLFERFGTAQVGFQDFLIEFVSARQESYLPESRKPGVRPGTLEEDIRRRDFTCNTLLTDSAGEVLDLTGQGLRDIEARLLRTPLRAVETFSEDPLRAVRAVRFAVTLGFEMDAEIMPAIRANLDRLATVVSTERVSDELRKMLLSARPGEAMRLLRQSGILARLMPEVDAMAGVEQSGFHHLDVLDHTLAALDAAAARPGNHLPADEELALRLGVLLHDVGKPVTVAHDGDRITFLGHPEAGAAMAREMLRRLRFSNQVAEAAARLVELHMRPIQYRPEEWSDGAVRRLVRESDMLLEPLLALAGADMAASAYPPEEAEEKLGDLRRRVETMDVEAVRKLAPPLDGHQLMERYDRPPGPWIGRVHQALVDAVLDGELPQGEGAEEAAWAYLEAHPELTR